jgi:hypothetical protein
MAKTRVTRNKRSKSGRTGTAMTAPRRSAARNNGGRLTATFSQRKSIEQLAVQQGVQLEGQLERILGAGADLWATDAEFEEFVEGIYQRRREGLNKDTQRKPCCWIRTSSRT